MSKDVAREVDSGLKKAEREAQQQQAALKKSIADELLEAVLTPGLRRDPSGEAEPEGDYTKRLETALRADFLKHATSK